MTPLVPAALAVRPPEAPSLVLRDLYKSYAHPAGAVNVLRGVNATFNVGTRVAIIGPSGSGKSTLLALLAGLDRPTAGSVVLAGTELSQLSEQELTRYRAKHLGIVFQQFHLLPHLSATENVALPLALNGQVQTQAQAQDALRRVGLGHRFWHYPAQLSGGECQRVAIARALIARPPVLLADEPSGNLDSKTGEQVMGQLFDLVAQTRTTLILVTHNEVLARQCDLCLVLTDGVLKPVERADS